MTENTLPQNVDVNVKEQPMPVCEPAALGLIGLAVAALVLAAADMKWTDGSESALMIPWALFLGATAQFIAGIMDFKRNNIFGATAFTTYSMLWYAVALTLLFAVYSDDGIAINRDHYAFGLIGFMVFSLILTVASAMTNKVLFGILIFIDLAIGTLIPHVLWDWATEPVGLSLIGVSLLSFYGAAAVLLNTMAGQVVLPMGDPLWTPAKK